MAHAETNILNSWLKKWNRWGIFFRVQVGRCYAGTVIRQWTEGGIKFMTLKNAYPMSLGVPGKPDYEGWHTVVIGLEHVGRKAAIYTAIEGKTPDGRVSAEQEHFMRVVREAGGIAFVVRAADTAPVEW